MPRVLGIDVGTSGLKAVLLDELGQSVDEATASYPLRTPRPGWAEQGTAAECRQITERVGAPQVLEYTANVALPGFTAPKLLWVKANWPDAYREAQTFLLPKDFIRFRLTGSLATDMSDASGTLLFDVRRRRWSEAMVAALDIRPELLPTAFEGTT